MKKVLQETALVAALGAVLAFAANALSPRGFHNLKTDYLPGRALHPKAPATNAVEAAAAKTNSPLEQLTARLQAEGLQLVDSNQVVQLFKDPGRDLGRVIFVDSRDETHYEAGHIPGAYLFNRFQQDRYLAEVVPACLAAEQVVFYCNGGDCDDSEHTAIMLRDSVPIPRQKVFIYGGGMNEWVTNGLPVETGARNSGQLTNLLQQSVSPKAEALKP